MSTEQYFCTFYVEIYKSIHCNSEGLTDVLRMHLAYAVGQVYQHKVSLIPC